MRSIDAREDLTDRRVPGHWQGDLIIGAHGKSAAATLVEGTTRFTVILALPEGKDSTGLADVLIDNANELPAMMGKTLTWDQGSQVAKDAAVSLATSMPVFFAHAHSPRERGTARHVHVRTAAHRELARDELMYLSHSASTSSRSCSTITWRFCSTCRRSANLSAWGSPPPSILACFC